MKRTILAGIFVLVFPCFLPSDTWWARTYGDPIVGYAVAVQQTQEGGFIVGAQVAGYYDSWILKLSAKGAVDWQYIYGEGKYGNNFALDCVQQTLDGGYVVANTVEDHILILKLFSNGMIEWQKNYGKTGTISAEEVKSIKQTLDGGYIVAGSTAPLKGSLDKNIWILKLSSIGNIEWQKKYGRMNYWDFPNSIQQTDDGGYIVAGCAESLGSHNKDFLILKLSSDGDVEWQRAYGTWMNETSCSIQQTRDGGYVVAGESVFLESTTLILKLSAMGDIGWQKSFSSVPDIWPSSIRQTFDGGYIVAGSAHAQQPPLNVLKLLANGEVEWSKTYGGEKGGIARSVQQLREGGYIVAGGNILIFKLPSNGEFGQDCSLKNDLRVNVWNSMLIPQMTNIDSVITNGKSWNSNISPRVANARTKIICSDIKINPPLNFAGQKLRNRSRSQIEYLNVLTWEKNPDNENITKYRIYLVNRESKSLLAELNANEYRYCHRSIRKDKRYDYAIVAVNDESREGQPAYVTIY